MTIVGSFLEKRRLKIQIVALLKKRVNFKCCKYFIPTFKNALLLLISASNITLTRLDADLYSTEYITQPPQFQRIEPTRIVNPSNS